MSSIPLPALDVRTPQPQENPLDQYARLMQVKNQMAMAPLQQQAMQQQIQGGQLENQQRQMDMQARQALNQAYASSMTTDDSGKKSFDPDKLQQSLMSGPAAYQTPAVMKGVTDFQKSSVDLQNSVADLRGKTNDMLGSAANAIKAAGYDPTLAHSLLDTLPPSPQTNSLRMQIDDPQALRQMVDLQIANSTKQQGFQNAKDVAALRANTPQMQGMNAWLQQNPGKSAADYQQHQIDMQTKADITRETNPQVIGAKEQVAGYEARMHQAVSQGDPNAAGQLLVNGDATLAELKSRGATPDFIAKSLFAAHKLSNGQYNAQQAEAQFDVAKSPTNVAFFGSAKSLTDPGGTLDQLASAAKDIPQNQIPVFNSIADAEKAATGSGPIAKYASLLVGVSDDYSKVMGGGQGSDASRSQGFKLAAASASPEQRAASIEGIRGAVGSQINARIGNNKVLQRMYGGNNGSPQSNSNDPFAQFGGKAHQ